jgi:nucleotide-binding universal stress UspA family protein
MKRILLPTDFSDNATNAIRYAFHLLKDDVCEFFILHTYSPTIISAGSMMDTYSALAMQQFAKETSQKNLNALEKTIANEFPNPNHTFTSISSFNMLIPEMTDIVEDNNIDLVIMGTQGATGAKEILMGTQTMYAIKKMKCPVIAVPSNFSYEAPKEILFPTDYKLNTSNKYMAMLRNVCDTYASRLHILNAYYGTPITEEQKDVKSFLDTYFINNAHLFHIAEGTDVLGAVEIFQRKTKINFLVMFHNKHNFFENMLFKPVINQIVYHTNVPFLVIPAIERQ